MSYTKETIKCPKCNEKIRVKVYHELKDDDLTKIYDMSFLKCKCSNCEEIIILNYDMSFKNDLFHVFYVSENNEIEDKFPVSRITKTHDDFKEKILILSDGFNDFVISFLKCFIHDEMKLSSYQEFNGIRYNEKTEDGLIFYALGIKKYISIPMDYYDKLLKKSKIKKVDKAILVDEVTFRNYMKVK